MHQITTGAAPGDSSIEALYDRNAYIVLHYLSRYISSREDVNDIVLDVFLAAMENQVWRTWSDGEQLAWLRRISYNKVVDYYRRASRHPLVGLEEIGTMLYEDDEYMPEHIALRNEDYSMLRVHLSHLSELQQETVCLRFGHGLRLKEIARHLNKNEGVVRVTLSRTLKSLTPHVSATGRSADASKAHVMRNEVAEDKNLLLYEGKISQQRMVMSTPTVSDLSRQHHLSPCFN